MYVKKAAGGSWMGRPNGRFFDNRPLPFKQKSQNSSGLFGNLAKAQALMRQAHHPHGPAEAFELEMFEEPAAAAAGEPEPAAPAAAAEQKKEEEPKPPPAAAEQKKKEEQKPAPAAAEHKKKEEEKAPEGEGDQPGMGDGEEEEEEEEEEAGENGGGEVEDGVEGKAEEAKAAEQQELPPAADQEEELAPAGDGPEGVDQALPPDVKEGIKKLQERKAAFERQRQEDAAREELKRLEALQEFEEHKRQIEAAQRQQVREAQLAQMRAQAERVKKQKEIEAANRARLQEEKNAAELVALAKEQERIAQLQLLAKNQAAQAKLKQVRVEQAKEVKANLLEANVQSAQEIAKVKTGTEKKLNEQKVAQRTQAQIEEAERQAKLAAAQMENAAAIDKTQKDAKAALQIAAGQKKAQDEVLRVQGEARRLMLQYTDNGQAPAQRIEASRELGRLLLQAPPPAAAGAAPVEVIQLDKLRALIQENPEASFQGIARMYTASIEQWAHDNKIAIEKAISDAKAQLSRVLGKQGLSDQDRKGVQTLRDHLRMYAGKGFKDPGNWDEHELADLDDEDDGAVEEVAADDMEDEEEGSGDDNDTDDDVDFLLGEMNEKRKMNAANKEEHERKKKQFEDAEKASKALFIEYHAEQDPVKKELKALEWRKSVEDEQQLVPYGEKQLAAVSVPKLQRMVDKAGNKNTSRELVQMFLVPYKQKKEPVPESELKAISSGLVLTEQAKAFIHALKQENNKLVTQLTNQARRAKNLKFVEERKGTGAKNNAQLQKKRERQRRAGVKSKKPAHSSALVPSAGQEVAPYGAVP